MRLTLFNSETADMLLAAAADNISRYVDGDFQDFAGRKENLIELDQDFDGKELSQLRPDESPAAESENCLRLYRALGSLTPYLACDRRLWVYLTHTFLLGYARRRWRLRETAKNKSAAELAKHIRTHFFASGRRGLERDNAASRLWWMTHLCARAEHKNLGVKNILEYLLAYANIRADIIERPSTSQYENVFRALVRTLGREHEKSKNSAGSVSRPAIFVRENFRELMKALNLHGGIKLLSTISEEDICRFIDIRISEINKSP